MNQVNFLPQAYVQRQSRRKRLGRVGVLLAVMTLDAVGLTLSFRQREAGLEDYAQSLWTQVTELDLYEHEKGVLESLYKDLARPLKIETQLMQPVSHTQVLATLSHLMPVAVAIKSLSVTGPEVGSWGRPARGAGKKAGGGRAPAAAERRLRYELKGVAPDDVEIAQFVSQLTDHPMFAGVTMHYSRAAALKRLRAREFYVEMYVPLNRDYQPVEARGDLTSADGT